MLIFLEQAGAELGQTQFKIGLDHTLIFCSLNIFFAHGLFLLKIPKKYFFSYWPKICFGPKIFNINIFSDQQLFWANNPTLFILSD